MLTFYYNPISTNARRVWVALLEKKLQFQPILVNFEGDGLGDEFLEINPFKRIPVLVDNGLRVFESLAILDYLEAKYPTPALMPIAPEEVAISRMVQMIAVNELQPATLILMQPLVGLEIDSQKEKAARERIDLTLQFYESLLDRGSYFTGSEISLADIVAGTLVGSLSFMGFSFDAYPNLMAWTERLAARESWQQTTPDPGMVEAALPTIKKILERRAR
ncbi:glutathione S-transferase family protein [Oscillatoria sp. FACHB-1406]|uniref:glutathione S-transferase family protein n=1 Tax=Oscillatoria sp. FACHB-1406 TaxID=2692846 RepID=UPI0016835DA9|nr:glutathione S-transferase family protein [Oscillatoria sp. FACHB-1406]MBD2576255.1 glutathione S-transferase family protein [Oscillatoria sp. FACHB-1406]